MRARSEIYLLLALLALALVSPFLAELTGQQYLISSMSRLLIFAIAAISLDLILGYGGLVSLGHAAYLGIGAYVVGILSFHAFEGTTLFGLPGTDNGAVSLPLAVAISAVTAALIGALCLRTSGIYFIMITLAFAQMLFFLSVSLQRYGGDDGLFMSGGANKIFGLDLGDDATLYFVSLAALVAFFLLCRAVVGSRFGRVLGGIRQNEPRMKTLGYSPYRYKIAAFALAGAGAGLAGGLIANHAEFVSPDLLHWTRSGELLFMVILGGMGSLTGAIFGAAAFLLLEEYLPIVFGALSLDLLKDHWRVVFGPLLILIMLFNRRGIYGGIFGSGGRDGR
ncbi:ABC superfamily ATP binding cassette transporter, permease protein [Hyphomicrobiales bacterium]|nr:ABC superfamily ATP binding cassette transporter, permease protein [Hyphomicrobiales bacterium]CAH1695304.1 ABC superfamily ATP binding cassette transporter, permease protein [Hyphomicrobiales bacterium]